jgi:hypothetical protein
MLLLFVILILLSTETLSKSHQSFSKSTSLTAELSHLEALGELYYENQKVERTKQWEYVNFSLLFIYN